MKSNTRFNQNKRGIECLNCQQPLNSIDNFCSNCGQVNDLKPLSIKQYLTEFLSGFFSFDTRTLNTVFPLIFKPGKVTNEYIHGERMKYVNPFQLYLHTSIIFFLITGIFSSIDSYKKVADNYNSEKFTEQKKDSLINIAKQDLNKTKKELTGTNFNNGLLKVNIPEMNIIKSKKDSVLTNSEIKKLIIQKSDSLFNYKKFQVTINDSLISIKEKDQIIDKLILNKTIKLYRKLIKDKSFENDSLKDFQNFKLLFINNIDKNLLQNNYTYKVSEKSKLDNDDKFISDLLGESFFKKISSFKDCKTKNAGRALDSLGYKRTTSNVFWFKKAKEIKALQHDKDAQSVYFSNAISKIAIVLFFMLPVFALFMKLFYIRRKANYTEHLIFIFHTQTVFFLLLLLEIIIERTFNTSVGIPVFILLFLVYLFIAMLKFYKQSKWKTFFKFILLNITYFFLSIIGSIFVMFLAFLM